MADGHSAHHVLALGLGVGLRRTGYRSGLLCASGCGLPSLLRTGLLGLARCRSFLALRCRIDRVCIAARLAHRLGVLASGRSSARRSGSGRGSRCRSARFSLGIGGGLFRGHVLTPACR